MDIKRIRNFCIIAHIDHGKSTLADRFLEVTACVSERKLHKQYLDLMDLEQEKGITIKLTPVRMDYKALDGQKYVLNLIDTPGHVDFQYEVSRSLAACEGAVVVVDASQGIEAQTLANIYLAMEQDLELIPVINKIDLPSAEPERVKEEMQKTLGFDPEEILEVSAKVGTGVEALMERIIERVPPPQGLVDGQPRALIFDSQYNTYKGALAYVRMVDGQLEVGQKISMLAVESKADITEVGFFRPGMEVGKSLKAGEVGYIAANLKTVSKLRVGDTITLDSSAKGQVKPLAGYKQVQPKVFAGIYPVSGEDYPDLREAMERLQLNDASLQFVPETSVALGFGFRCGFLGLLHMDIIQERLEREYDLNLIFTAPNVQYQVKTQETQNLGFQEQYLMVQNPSEFPEDIKILDVLEPWVKLSIITPSQYIGRIMELASDHRGIFLPTEYLDEKRVNMQFEIPLSEVIINFYDQLKTLSQGYASMDYEPIGMRSASLEKLKVLVHDQEVDAFAQIVPKQSAAMIGRSLVEKLKELIPKQMFEFKIQAALGGKVIATAKMSGMRKDVTAKLYGGDRSRKDKLLKKQKAGKKRMKMVGSVEVPQEAFQVMLSHNGDS